MPSGKKWKNLTEEKPQFFGSYEEKKSIEL